MNEPVTQWLKPPGEMRLGSNQVDVWKILLGLPHESLPSKARLLSVEETNRSAQFHFELDRHRFILAHARLREILATYLLCNPADIEISNGIHGKPALVNSTFEFNLSHSGEYALIAIADRHKLGIDVEFMRENIELENITRRNFSAQEVEEFLALPPEQRMRGFYHGWTRKEAYIKGQGLGLSLPLDSFDVTLTPGRPAILRATRHKPDEASRWILRSLDVASAYVGALAVNQAGSGSSGLQDLDIRHWEPV